MLYILSNVGTEEYIVISDKHYRHQAIEDLKLFVGFIGEDTKNFHYDNPGIAPFVSIPASRVQKCYEYGIKLLKGEEASKKLNIANREQANNTNTFLQQYVKDA